MTHPAENDVLHEALSRVPSCGWHGHGAYPDSCWWCALNRVLPPGETLPDCEGWTCQSCGADNFIPPGFERVLTPDVTDEPVVCIAHGSFIPCRKDGEHRYTSNPYWVKAVRDYHSSPIEGLTWEPGHE